MVFTGKTAPRKRNENSRGRKRPKKNNITNSFFFLNSNPLSIFSLIFFFVFFLIPPFLFPPVLPPSPPLIPLFLSPNSLITPPPIPFSNLFHDTRP